MLQQVCEHLNNYFIREAVKGTFRIEGGAFSSPLPLLEGQRFLIVGSTLNDGVYTWHSTGINDDDDIGFADLQDEEFSGTVAKMAVPKSVLDLSKDISDWQTKYGDAVNSPYQSENVIGVYSYEKMGATGVTGQTIMNWATMFKDRLNRWRKICL